MPDISITPQELSQAQELADNLVADWTGSPFALAAALATAMCDAFSSMNLPPATISAILCDMARRIERGDDLFKVHRRLV